MVVAAVVVVVVALYGIVCLLTVLDWFIDCTGLYKIIAISI